MRRLRGSPGFTLIEMIAVMALIGIIAAFVVTSVSTLGSAEMRSAARNIAGTIRYVYQTAILSKKVMRICFDLETQSYWSEYQDPKNRQYIACQDEFLGRHELPPSVLFRDVQIMDSACQGPCQIYLYFTQYGYVEQATIHLSDEDGRNVFTIFTEPMTGRTVIYDEDMRLENMY